MTECVNEQIHFLKSDFLHGIRVDGIISQFNRVILEKKFSKGSPKFQKSVRYFLQLIFGCKLFSLDDENQVRRSIGWNIQLYTLESKDNRRAQGVENMEFCNHHDDEAHCQG